MSMHALPSDVAALQAIIAAQAEELAAARAGLIGKALEIENASGFGSAPSVPGAMLNEAGQPKGKRAKLLLEEMHMRLDLALFVDVEASGFGPSSWPVEVGWCDSHGSGSAILIRPDQDWTHWNGAAAGTHHILREDLARNGLDRQHAAAQFLAPGRHLFSDSPEVQLALHRAGIVFSMTHGIFRRWCASGFSAVPDINSLGRQRAPLQAVLQRVYRCLWHCHSIRPAQDHCFRIHPN